MPNIDYQGSSPARESFTATLGLAEGCPPGSGWVCGPLGLGLHVLAVAALVGTAAFSPVELIPPGVSPLVLNLAPPPPPPPIQSSEAPGAIVLETRPSSPTALVAPGRIPEEVLSPEFEVPGVEAGFLDGSVDGLQGGIPGGVVGGIPGGIVDGVVGGTGDDLPRYPKPDVGPSPIRMPQPTYTEQAIRDNVKGTVVLRVVIDDRGSVRVLKVLRSVPELDDEAIRVVEASWLFQPATKNGRPISALSDLVVRFSLH
jgi:protein TonB